ncbi:MAG: glycosyltransferase family 4 protein [Candidatus Anstonellales archaeon]
MKKVLFIVNSFYPDITATSQLLSELVFSLKDDFNITVLAGNHTSYKHEDNYINGVRVIRVSVPRVDKSNKVSRIKYILSYFMNVLNELFKLGKYDAVFALGQPPVLGGILGLIAKHLCRAKFIYNIQDWSPEQIEVIKYIKNKILISILRHIDTFVCKKSDCIVTISNSMAETLYKRFKGKDMPRYEVIRNWANKFVYQSRIDTNNVLNIRKKYGLEGKFVFMYSGNIGLYYGLEAIVRVFGDMELEDVVLVLVGEGALKSKLMDYVKCNNIKNVIFIPFVSQDELVDMLNVADVHIVCSMKGMVGVSFTSKVYNILAIRKPMLCILDKGSEIIDMVKEYRNGLFIEVGDEEGLKLAILKMVNREVRYEFNYDEQAYIADFSINRYKELIGGVGDDRGI